jgi:hypothetical protein
MAQRHSTRLQGKTLSWTFDDGPVAGKTFEHRFNDDGTIEWHAAGAAAAKTTLERECASADTGDRASVVSYRAASGYTLTVVLDFAEMTLLGFGSNSDMWSQQRGRFAVVA